MHNIFNAKYTYGHLINIYEEWKMLMNKFDQDFIMVYINNKFQSSWFINTFFFYFNLKKIKRPLFCFKIMVDTGQWTRLRLWYMLYTYWVSTKFIHKKRFYMNVNFYSDCHFEIKCWMRFLNEKGSNFFKGHIHVEWWESLTANCLQCRFSYSQHVPLCMLKNKEASLQKC